MRADMFLEVENEPEYKPRKYPNPSLGWRLTEEEELRIRLACRNALKFMKSYGRGADPIMVDRSRYYTSDNPYLPIAKEQTKQSSKSKKKTNQTTTDNESKI